MLRGLSGSQWRYCAKVGIATALGYVLTQGGLNEYAIYSAFTAALIVGTSVGEDLATSINRVKGTLAGMLAGMLASALVGPNFLTIGLSATLTGLIALVVNDRHDIHHVRERGYVEAPVRVRSILDGILPTGLFWRTRPRVCPDALLRSIHDPGLIDYMRRACAKVKPGKSVYPYVFPIRNVARPPKDLAYAAGYWCIDTFTPLNRNAWRAGRRAVDCAFTAAEIVRGGQRFQA